ncbi:MAG: hypothetical protein ACFUZC_01590 [Chthoniobacteraceae bacterium]
MNPTLTFLAALILAAAPVFAGEPNLVPNADFSAANPLETWRIDFPYAGPYAKNKDYVQVTASPIRPGKCALIDLPPGVAGNEGGKIESAFIPAEPGATYHVEIDCLTWNFAAKAFVEAWIEDPAPIPQRDKFRIPAMDGHPPLVTVYRAQLPDPKAKSKSWETISRDFTLPPTMRVGGKDYPPQFLTLKAYTYAGTREGGKSYFTNFRLTKIKPAQP